MLTFNQNCLSFTDAQEHGEKVKVPREVCYLCINFGCGFSLGGTNVMFVKFERCLDLALICCSGANVSHEFHRTVHFCSPGNSSYSLSASSAFWGPSLQQQKPKWSMAAACDELRTSAEKEAATGLWQRKQTLENLSGAGGRGRKLESQKTVRHQ